MVSNLLIQSRGYDRNLLAVEMKKPRNRKTVEEDKKRLKSLVPLLLTKAHWIVCMEQC